MLPKTLRHSRGWRAALVAVALVTAESCYAYRPLVTPTPQVGARIRVALTPRGIDELARYLGPNVAIVNGELTSMTDDGTMIVAVDFVQTINGIRQPWTGEGVVSIPAALRSDVQQRVFLRRQSWIAGGALTAALVATAIVAIRAAGAEGSGGNGGGQPPP